MGQSAAIQKVTGGPPKGAKKLRVLDLFCGQLGWSKAFLARGWEVVAIDLAPNPILAGIDWDRVQYLRCNVLEVTADFVGTFDFVCASSVCDGFASFGMKHFRPNPPPPTLEIELFNHTRSICEKAGVAYVMENVRTAQQFVGPAENHCGPFYLWGNAVPPILPQGISKAKWYRRPGKPGNFAIELNLSKPKRKALLATIPPELANCVAEFAERILEARSGVGSQGPHKI